MAESRVYAALAFLVLCIACAGLIAATAAFTDARIEENRARRFQQTLTELAGSARAAAGVRWAADDTAILCHGSGALLRGSGALLRGSGALLRGSGALLRGSASGYGGPIHWLAAATIDGPQPVLTRLRISAHQETPGIADFLDEPDAGWLASLSGASAAALADVDAVSGATITSRALARSLAAALRRPSLQSPECPA